MGTSLAHEIAGANGEVIALNDVRMPELGWVQVLSEGMTCVEALSLWREMAEMAPKFR